MLQDLGGMVGQRTLRVGKERDRDLVTLSVSIY